MSGPIVRKYGFPNFEKIFGDRGMQHGVDDATEPASAIPGPEAPAETAESSKASPKKGKTKKK